jgi:hypothetical protein
MPTASTIGLVELAAASLEGLPERLLLNVEDDAHESGARKLVQLDVFEHHVESWRWVLTVHVLRVEEDASTMSVDGVPNQAVVVSIHRAARFSARGPGGASAGTALPAKRGYLAQKELRGDHSSITGLRACGYIRHAKLFDDNAAVGLA